MSLRGIGIGASGLLASQRAVELASHNISNVNTDGYSRRRVTMKAIDAGSGSGVLISSTDRIRDLLADMAWRAEAGTAGFTAARNTVLTRVEDALGPFGEGLNQAVDAYYAAWDALSLNPKDPGARSTALNAANRVAGEFNRVYTSQSDYITEAMTQASDTLRSANSLLSQVAALNGAIQQSQAAGADVGDLLDKRDNAVDKLATMLGATAHADQGGLIEVRIGGMQVVSGTQAYPLQFGGTGLVGDPYTVQRTDGTAIEALYGSVGGLLQVVNTDIPALRARLDLAAVAMKDTANAVHTAGFDLNGGAGLDLFTGSGAANLSVNALIGTDVTLVAASTSGAAGDGNQALAMAKLRNPSDPNGAPALLRQFNVDLGALVDNAQKDETNSTAVLSGLTDRRLSTNGVNTDEEMVDLVRYQRAYQAAAKTVAIADDMLDTLINRMGI